MRKILLPIDGSEPSLRAARYLIDRAADLKQPPEVVLLNVQPVSRRGDTAADGRSAEEWAREEGRKALAGARRLLEEAGIRHRHHVEIGEPVELINHYARIYHCDEIVMGTRGTTSIINLVLGSVTTKVLHVASVPVVLVK
jgi:nucleotide-binding universal stress UspA family protein